MGLSRTGAVFVLLTVNSKVSVMDCADSSVVVIVMIIVPTSLFVGVPLNVRVAELKLSHAGKAFPLD
jgi:hypothetical protein